jgi:hypothetical protein
MADTMLIRSERRAMGQLFDIFPYEALRLSTFKKPEPSRPFLFKHDQKSPK